MNDVNTHKQESDLNFEAAFARLEVILEQVNVGNISLDEAIKLYEEANQLIINCNNLLNSAERKVESLVKNRTGELICGSDSKPLTQDYTISSS